MSADRELALLHIPSRLHDAFAALLTIDAAMGDVVARVVEHAFDWLDAPPLRVHQEDVPLPYAANLEALALPSVEKIIKAAKAVSYK